MESENLEKYQDISKLLKETKTGDKVTIMDSISSNTSETSLVIGSTSDTTNSSLELHQKSNSTKKNVVESSDESREQPDISSSGSDSSVELSQKSKKKASVIESDTSTGDDSKVGFNASDGSAVDDAKSDLSGSKTTTSGRDISLISVEKMSVDTSKKQSSRVKYSSEDDFDIFEYHTNEELDDSLKKQNSKKKKRSSWVQCDEEHCQKWRRIDHVSDVAAVETDKWVCSMNDGSVLDPLHNNCACSQETIPEDSDTDFEELEDQSIYTQYKPGAIVLGKMPGYPWWPCIVEDDPDFDSYFYLEKKNRQIMVSYHVTFFGKDVSRAWLKKSSIVDFDGYETLTDLGTTSSCGKSFARRAQAALMDAQKALQFPPDKRVSKFGFLRRYKGNDRPKSGDINVCKRKAETETSQGRRANEKISEGCVEENKNADESDVAHKKSTFEKRGKKQKEFSHNLLRKEEKTLFKAKLKEGRKQENRKRKKKSKKCLIDIGGQVKMEMPNKLKEQVGEASVEPVNERCLGKGVKEEIDNAQSSDFNTVGFLEEQSKNVDMPMESTPEEKECGTSGDFKCSPILDLKSERMICKERDVVLSKELTPSQEHAEAMVNKYCDPEVIREMMSRPAKPPKPPTVPKEKKPKKPKTVKDKNRTLPKDNTKARKSQTLEDTKEKKPIKARIAKANGISEGAKVGKTKSSFNKERNKQNQNNESHLKHPKAESVRSYSQEEILLNAFLRNTETSEKLSDTVVMGEKWGDLDLDKSDDSKEKELKSHKSLIDEAKKEGKGGKSAVKETPDDTMESEQKHQACTSTCVREEEKTVCSESASTRAENEINKQSEITNLKESIHEEVMHSGGRKSDNSGRKTCVEEKKSMKTTAVLQEKSPNIPQMNNPPKLVEMEIPKITPNQIIKDKENNKLQVNPPKLKKSSFQAPVKSKEKKKVPLFKAPTRKTLGMKRNVTPGNEIKVVEPPLKKKFPEENKEPQKGAKKTLQGDGTDIDLDATLDVDEPKKRDNALHSSPEF